MSPAGSVAPELSHAIDLVETAYDFEKSDSGWLDALTEAGAPIFDQGHGFSIDEYLVTPRGEGARWRLGTFATCRSPPTTKRVSAT